MENNLIMTENQERICDETLEELKNFCKENDHIYTPIKVYYVPSENNRKSIVICNVISTEEYFRK